MIDTRSLSRQLVILTALLAVLGGCGPRASEPAARGHFPSQRDLENLTYRSGFTRTGRVQLIHGAYQEPIRGSSQTLMVTLSPSLRLLGALNEHQDGAAVILRTVAGTVQRGEFYDLAAVVKTDTVAQNVAIASLGDRIKVRSVMLDNSRIIVDMLTHGPKDRISRPTLLVRRTYVLRGEKLVLQTSEPLEE
jgi:hypothetical protein